MRRGDLRLLGGLCAGLLLALLFPCDEGAAVTAITVVGVISIGDSLVDEVERKTRFTAALLLGTLLGIVFV